MRTMKTGEMVKPGNVKASLRTRRIRASSITPKESGLMKYRIVAGAMGALLACGGTNPGGVPVQSPTCSVTLSGAVTGTYDCNPATAVWQLSGNRGGFSFALSPAGSTPYVAVSIDWVGEPSVGHYKSGDATASGGVSVAKGGRAWNAISYDLDIASVLKNVAVPTGKAYVTDGALDATLGTTPSDTITLHATF